MIREEVATVIQLRNAKATESWYFWHSPIKPQMSKSLKYSIATPLEEEAAASVNVAVICNITHET